MTLSAGTMGTGATSGLVQAVSASSDSDLKASLSCLPDDLKKKLGSALEGCVDSETWALKKEATRIFRLADKDGSGFIDMTELANLRNSKEWAETMMEAQDGNVDGKLSLGEWLDYVKRTFDKKEATCKAMLKLYEKQISQNKDLTAKPAAEKAELAEDQAEPAAEKAEVAVDKAEPAAETAEPAAEKAEPVTEKVELATDKVENAVETAEPAAEKAELVVDKADPAAEKAEE